MTRWQVGESPRIMGIGFGVDLGFGCVQNGLPVDGNICTHNRAAMVCRNLRTHGSRVDTQRFPSPMATQPDEKKSPKGCRSQFTKKGPGPKTGFAQ